MKKILASIAISIVSISFCDSISFAEFKDVNTINEVREQIKVVEETNEGEIQEQIKVVEETNEDEIQEQEVDTRVEQKYENIKSLVSQFYLAFHNRNADEDGLNYWSNEIYNSKQTVSQVLLNFIYSDEYDMKNKSNSDYVIDLYEGLYNRYPDNSGLSYWVNELNLGENRVNILSNVFNSNEFQGRLNDIGIKNKGEITYINDNGKVKFLVNQFYKGLFNRTSDEDGLNYWTNEIVESKYTVAQVLEIFINSDEFISKKYNNKQYVECLYKTLLGRDADKEGLNYWTSILESGNSKEFVLANNFQSKEFQSRLDEIGIKNKGSINIDITDRKGDVKSLINNIYIGIYGRTVDEDGANYWSDVIVYKKQTMAQVILEFINSQEFKSKNYSGEQYVKVLYKALLGRDADIDGLNYWLSQLINGKTERYVLSHMFNSNEFKGKLNEIGITNIGEITLSTNDTKETVAKARVRVSAINLREQPSQNSKILTQLKSGNLVTVLGRISTNDTKETVAKARVRVSAINLREQPSQNSKILTQLKSGNLVTVLGRIKGDLTYYKVQYVNNGKIYTGYVSITLSSGNSLEIFEDNVNNEFLGVLSEKYESNGDPGRVSDTPGDYGGKSYGAWQFSSKMGSLDSFVNWLKGRNTSFYNKLMDARKLDGNTNCGENFDKAWKEIARDHYNTFYTLQQTYVKENNYDKLVNRLLKVGNFSNVLSSFSARNVIWSTVVQHGVSGAYNIIAPLKNITDVEEFITAVYAERGRTDANGILVYFKSSSIAVQQSVAKRFVNEKNEAIKLYRYSIN